MVFINNNPTATQYVTNSPTVTTCSVESTPVVTTSSAMLTPTGTSSNTTTYTAIVPQKQTETINTPTSTPTVINGSVPTPTTNVTEVLVYTTNATGSVSGSGNPSTVDTSFVTPTPDYSTYLKLVEEAFWQTSLGLRTETYMNNLEEWGQGQIDMSVDWLERLINSIFMDSIPTTTFVPTQTGPVSDNYFSENFSAGFTSGGYKNLGVSAGLYDDNFYLEASYKVRGFNLSAGIKNSNGRFSISTGDFKSVVFKIWYNDFCGGNLNTAIKYCSDNGININFNWETDSITVSAGVDGNSGWVGANVSF